MLKKAMFFLALAAAALFQARAGVYGELLLDWETFLNPAGKYELVYAPTFADPDNWEIKDNQGFNAFEIRRGLVGYRSRLNDYVAMGAAVLVEDQAQAGIEFRVDQAWVQVRRPENLYYDFKMGLQLTPYLEWDRNYLWPYEMFEFPPLQFLGLLPRSQAGALAGFGYKSELGHIGVEADYLADDALSGPDSNRFDARFLAGAEVGEFLLDGIFNYTFRGKPEERNRQEMVQAGLVCQVSRLKIGGEYFRGSGWIPAGEVYYLGNFPEGFKDFSLFVGRSFATGKTIDFYGWSATASIQPVDRVFLVYRYDFFEPSAEFDDDQENLNLGALVYRVNDSLEFGAAFQRQDFAARNLPGKDQDDELEPLQTFVLGMTARLP